MRRSSGPVVKVIGLVAFTACVGQSTLSAAQELVDIERLKRRLAQGDRVRVQQRALRVHRGARREETMGEQKEGLPGDPVSTMAPGERIDALMKHWEECEAAAEALLLDVPDVREIPAPRWTMDTR